MIINLELFPLLFCRTYVYTCTHSNSCCLQHFQKHLVCAVSA